MNRNPKSLYEVLNQMSHRDLQGFFAEKPSRKEKTMLKAYSNKYANQTVVVGDSVFKFGGDGYCEVEDTGYTLYDFKQLCRMKAVKEVKEKEKITHSVSQEKSSKEEPKKEVKKETTKQEPEGDSKASGYQSKSESKTGSATKTKTKKQSSKPRTKMSFFSSSDETTDKSEDDVNDD